MYVGRLYQHCKAFFIFMSDFLRPCIEIDNGKELILILAKKKSKNYVRQILL